MVILTQPTNGSTQGPEDLELPGPCSVGECMSHPGSALAPRVVLVLHGELDLLLLNWRGLLFPRRGALWAEALSYPFLQKPGLVTFILSGYGSLSWVRAGSSALT